MVEACDAVVRDCFWEPIASVAGFDAAFGPLVEYALYFMSSCYSIVDALRKPCVPCG